MEGEQSQTLSELPVSTRDHYEIVKFVEQKVKDHLGAIERDWLLVGLRVSYYELPHEGSEELGHEYKMEYGYLEALDHTKEEKVRGEEEWMRIVEESRHKNPLPIEFVNELYEEVKRKLQERAGGQQLLVSVVGVLMGSGYRCWGSSCTCWRYGKFCKRYYYYHAYARRCIPYCTWIEC